MPNAEHHVGSLAHGVGIGQPVEDGQDVAGRDVAGAEACGCGNDARDPGAVGRPIGQGSLDLAGQRIVMGRRFIGPFNDRHRRRGA